MRCLRRRDGRDSGTPSDLGQHGSARNSEGSLSLVVLSLPAPWELRFLSANTPSWGQRRGPCLRQDLAPVDRPLGVAGTVAAGGKEAPAASPQGSTDSALTPSTLLEAFGCPSGLSRSQRAVPPLAPWLPESSGLGTAGRYVVVTCPHLGRLKKRHSSVLTVCTWHQCCWAHASFEPRVSGKEGKRWRGRRGELV